MRRLKDEELYKIYRLFKLTLPEDVEIGYFRDLYHGCYCLTFRKEHNGILYGKGFLCTKKGFQKNGWYQLRENREFFRKVGY